MRALLYKDLIMTWKYCKILLLPVLVIAVAGGYQSELTFFGVYAPLVLTAISQTTLSYDERCGWLDYAAALPYGSNVIVGSKYLLALLGCLAGILLPLASAVGFGLARGALSLERLLFLTVGMLAAGTLNSVIMLPVSFRFGTGKGRLVYIVILACLFAFGSRVHISDLLMLRSTGLLLAGLTAVCLVLWAVSYLISLKCYQPRRV